MNKPFQSLILRLLSLVTAISIGTNPVRAQSVSFPVREMSNKLYASDLTSVPLKSMTVANDQRANMLASPTAFSNAVKYKSNFTTVSFSIDHGANLVPTAPYLYKLVYMLEGDPGMSGGAYSFTAYDTLIIAFNPDSSSAYKDVEVRTYPNLFEAKLTVLGVYNMSGGTPVSMTLPPPNTNFYVELSMKYQPYLKTHALPADMALNTAHSYNGTNKTLLVSWSPATTPAYLGKVTPAMYELEWTYVDNYAADGGRLDPSQVAYNFKNNATRILTDTLAYPISIAYPKGYLVYRVRMVRPDPSFYVKPIYGVWSLPNATAKLNTISSFKYFEITTPHTGDSINWNYTVHFAEGGKSKHVVNYADGLLKLRQSLTRFNTRPDLLLTTEPIYDYEGRQSITTIPTVISAPYFSYQPGVSISSVTGKTYSAKDFDIIPRLCPDAIVIPPFSNASLANRYYSKLNTDTAGMQKFVPQAEGYPFVHTQLSVGRDRVDAVGAPGPDLQINNGHEIKNEYMQADQPDLNSLFGIGVGKASYYTKTMTKDQNGQLSMSVKDLEGKQIVSSLVGASVDTTQIAMMFNDEVPPTGKFRENKLADSTMNVTIGKQKKYAGSFFMDFAAMSNIKYEYAFKPFEVCPAPAFIGLQVKCTYEYDVHDNCGVEILHKYGELGRTGTTTSPIPAPFSEDTTLALEKGKYTVNKTMTIAQSDIVAAVDSFFLRSPNCLRTEDDFIRDEVEATKYPCPGTDPCKELKYKLIDELYTDAKYGKWRPGYGKIYIIGGSISPDTNSIYDIPQWIPTGELPKYRFQNECVAPALNALVISKGGKTYRNISGPLSVTDDATGVETIYTESSDIVKFFKDEIYTGSDRAIIAEALLPLHPEYCKLASCFVDTLEMRLKNIPNAAAAVKYGLFGLEDIIAKDGHLITKMKAPPFNYSQFEDSLRLMINHTMRIDTVAATLAFCTISDAMVYNEAAKYFRPKILALDFPTASVRDYYFEQLKTFYLFNRSKFVSMAQTGAGKNCPPCDSNARMKLIPYARIPVIYAKDGSFSTDKDGMLESFTDTGAIGRIKRFFEEAARFASGDTTGVAAKGAIAATETKRMDSLLCAAAVDSIAKKLINCYGTAAAGARLKDSLQALVTRGEVHNGIFMPEQVRRCIIGAGLSLTDLCHPYLIAYDYFDEGSSNRGTCKSSAFYNTMAEFFNQPDIVTKFKAAGPYFYSFTPSWPSTNLFATKLSEAINGGTGPVKAALQYIHKDSLYIYSFFRSGSDTVVFHFRSPAYQRKPADTSKYPFLEGSSSDSVAFAEGRCFFADPNAKADGYIGRFMFTAILQRYESTSAGYKITGGSFLGWTNGKMEMNESGSSDIAACIPCTEYKKKYKQFKDSMTLYGGYATDHPYFSRSLRNFMNLNLRRIYSEGQYNRFLESCAFADSTEIPAYGAYGRISFPTPGTPSYANFDAWNDALFTATGLSAASAFDYWVGTNQTVYLDYEVIAPKDYRAFNQQVTAAGGIVKDIPSGKVGRLWVPVGTPHALFLGGTPFVILDSAVVKVKPNPYRAIFEDFKMYTLSDTSAKPWKINRGMDTLESSLYNSGITNFWVPYRKATVNKDYYNPKKAAYLSYVYKFQDSSMAKVLDTLQDYFIPDNVSPFSGSTVSYRNPQNAYRFTDLYYADASSRFPAYDTVLYILNAAKTHLGGGKIFLPVGTNKSVAFGVAGSGANLILYRCGDGLYWYRYFGKKSKMFNLFIRVPQYIYDSQHPNFQLVGIRTHTGDTASQSFDALITVPGSGDTITARGTTNFDISWSLRLRDVLLGNEKNLAAEKEEVVSGEEGADLNCEQQLLRDNVYQGKIKYYNYIKKFREDLLASFTDHVMKQAGEKLWIEYINMRFGITLYSYDRANNLIRTVPPEGVRRIDTPVLDKIDSLRASNGNIPGAQPLHLKQTSYEYSTANLCWKETTPDAGTKLRYFDKKGNVLLSQSARQRKEGLFTYFLYDQQNRLNETGEVKWAMDCPYFDPMPLYYFQQGHWYKNPQPSPCACENAKDSVWEYCGSYAMDFYDDAAFNAQVRTKARTQVVYTVYDSAFKDMSVCPNMVAQENLRSRIAASMYYLSCNPGLPAKNYDHAMHYSYDAAGNVQTLMREFPQLEGYGHRYKRVDYDYDLWSGKVNMISYNRGMTDQFYQKYDYDADNRITAVYSGRDGLIWTKDAAYTYYQHGPLARIDLGEQKVQGVDYAYTIQGWLKSINGDLADSTADMGGDGKRSTITPPDVYATTIDYFKNDYKAIGNTALSKVVLPNKGLYNGNIARQSTDVAPFGGLTTAYTYDQMNRIKHARYAATKRDSALTYLNKYASAYKYDMDGNIRTLVRRDGVGDLMDTLVYTYESVRNNRLFTVNDYSYFSKPGVDDIQGSAYVPHYVAADEDGNVVADATSKIERAEWNIYGKPTTFKRMYPPAGYADTIAYGYDAAGQRTYKWEVVRTDTGRRYLHHFYVREASGNILAEYRTMRQFDKGGVISILKDIRDKFSVTPSVLKHAWLAVLDSMAVLRHPAIASFVVSRAGDSALRVSPAKLLASDPALSYGFFAGNTGALKALPAYSIATGKYPLGDALSYKLAAEDPRDVLSGLSTGLFKQQDTNKLDHSLTQLAAQVPDLWNDVAADQQITVSSATDSAVVMSSLKQIATNPQVFAFRLHGYLNQEPTILNNWLNAVSADSTYTHPDYKASGLELTFKEALLQYGARAVDDSSAAHNTDRSDEGMYAFADWWPGAASALDTLAAGSSTYLDKISYGADPITYLEGIGGYDLLDSALAHLDVFDVVDVEPRLEVELERTGTIGGTVELGSRGPAQTAQDITLANHHIYGSNRVGLHNYWPQQYYSSWNFKEGKFDTTLNKRRPWYSLPSNELVDTNYSDPWGHGLARSITAEHILGLRQYELTNQTQNVMAVVLDKRFIKTTGNGNRDRFMASISAAYDYYPYGMLMPGRTTADTTTHCMTVMKEFKSAAPFPKAADMSKAVATLGGTFTPPAGGGVMFGTTVYGRSGGLKLDLDVVPGDAIDVRADILWISGFMVVVSVSETTAAGVKRTIASSSVSLPGLVTLPVRPSVNKITLTIDNMSSFVTAPSTGVLSVGSVSYDSLAYWSQWSPVTICDKNVDKYPFGFNGQMKSNDVAGIGNFNTAEFWEYNTRTGRRLNPDPISMPWESVYATNSDNPIIYKDPKGDFRTWAGAFLNKMFSGGGKIGKDDETGEYYIARRFTNHLDPGSIAVSRIFDAGGRRWGIKGRAAGDQIAKALNNSFMNHKGRTFDDYLKNRGSYKQGAGVVWTDPNGQGQETSTAEKHLFMDPIAMPGLNIGGSPGVTGNKFKILGMFKVQFKYNDLGNSMENFVNFYRDMRDYSNGDKPVIRRDGPKSYFDTSDRFQYQKELWHIRAKDGDTIPNAYDGTKDPIPTF